MIETAPMVRLQILVGKNGTVGRMVVVAARKCVAIVSQRMLS